MPQDLDEVDEPDVLADDDLDDLADDVVDPEEDLNEGVLGEDYDVPDEDEVDAVDDITLEEVIVPGVGVAKAVPAATEDADEEDEEDEEDEDVEASLDMILKERLVVEEPEEDEDDVLEVDDRTDGVERVLPKQPDEFVCRSCFLVKHPSQLADKEHLLCRDCV